MEVLWSRAPPELARASIAKVRFRPEPGSRRRTATKPAQDEPIWEGSKLFKTLKMVKMAKTNGRNGEWHLSVRPRRGGAVYAVRRGRVIRFVEGMKNAAACLRSGYSPQ